MKKIIALAALGVLAIGAHEYFRRKARNVFPHEGGWHEVETMDEPEEFGAPEGPSPELCVGLHGERIDIAQLGRRS